MKVLLIAHEKNMGGASKSLVTLAKELIGKGAEVHAVIPFSGGGVEKALINENIPYKHIFFGWWMEPSYWNALLKMSFRALHYMESLAVNRICSYAKKNGIQIIHSNSSAIDVGAKAALKLGIPHVWHIREFGDLDYRLDFMNAQRGDKSRAIEYMLSVPGKIVFISMALEEYYLKSLAGAREQQAACHEELELGNNQRDNLNDSCGYGTEPDEIIRRFHEASKVIYNGISKDYLINKSEEGHREGGKRDTQIAPQKVVFLIAANLQRSKRQNLAIEAVKILKQEGYSDFKFIIAGGTANTTDSREYEAELREQAKGLGKLVEFTGSVSDMRSLRAETDVELVLSESEAFGRVTIEAMMASNPVIATDAGANRELIMQNVNGVLINDAKTLADACKRFIDNPAEIRIMGGLAYKYASENFPSEKNSGSVYALYEELVERIK